MLSQEGLKEILERNGWWIRPPALGLWLLLAVSLLLITLGALGDARVYRSGLWRDEYFLTDLPPVSRKSWLSACKGCMPSMPWLRRRDKPEDSAAEAEIEVRVPSSPAQEPVQAQTGRRPSQSSLHSIFSQLSWLRDGLPDSQKLQMRQEMLQRLRPSLASSMQERVICRNTLSEVARQHNIHASSIQTHIWGRSGWVQGSLALQRSPQLKMLARDLAETLPRTFVNVHTSRASRLWAVMLASHPVYELWMCDLHMTAAKRAKIMMDCMVGSLALALVFPLLNNLAQCHKSVCNEF